MIASLGGRYDPWPVKRSTDWLTATSPSRCLVPVMFILDQFGQKNLERDARTVDDLLRKFHDDIYRFP